MLSSILGPTSENLVLLRQDGSTAPAETALQGAKYLLLYFSAGWCPPCRMFTPQMAAFYESFHESHKFEVIFISRDRDERSMLAYFHNPRHSRLAVRGGEGSHGNWLAVPYDQARDLGTELMRRYSVSGIPTVLLFDLESGEMMTREARSLIVRHAHTAEGFPWEGSISSSSVPPGLLQIAALILIIIVLYFADLWRGF